jgi:tetratricopeptide (TPR) repeat protein
MSLLCVVVVVAIEAHAAPGQREPLFDEAELVAAATLSSAAVDTPSVPSREDAFGLDAEMQAFVAGVADIRDSRQKLAALLEGMEQRGLFSLDYAETTRTVSATFHGRQGNCLSFTMLLVTLARAAGLTATYQSVAVPPTWSNDGQVVIANHVNAVIRTAQGEDTVVDFNIRDYEGRQPSRRVSDDYALGLFYTNLGAEALLREEYAASLAYLREAARAYPETPGVWVNLGVLYGRHGLYDHAEAAYLRALDADSAEPSALANLVVVYTAIREPELAEVYRERVQSYRERNPYYHYAVAVEAYEQQRHEDALEALRKALRLKHDEHEFYTLRGRVLEALGRTRGVAENFERARHYAAVEAAKSQERVRFDALAAR